jgi:hypothetical protein
MEYFKTNFNLSFDVLSSLPSYDWTIKLSHPPKLKKLFELQKLKSLHNLGHLSKL